MKIAVAILCLVLIGCAAKRGPVYDYNDIPNGYSVDGLPTSSVGSKDYQDGFRKGFYEGLAWNAYTTNTP